MTSVTLRLPDETYSRLDLIARDRGISVDQLFDEMAALMVAETDTQAHFRTRAARGHGKATRGLELLHKAAGHGGEA